MSELDGRAISGDHRLDFIECLCGEAFNTTAAFVAHCEPDGMPVSGAVPDLTHDAVPGECPGGGDHDLACWKCGRIPADQLDESPTPQPGWRERVGCTCSPGDGSTVCPREAECEEAWRADQLDVSPISGEEPWHCQQIANGPNPIIVCHRADLQAEIDRLRAELGR